MGFRRDGWRVGRTVKALLPEKAKDAAARVVLFSDRESRRAFRDAQSAADHDIVALRLRRLNGRPFLIRRGTDDPWAVRETFVTRDQMPPRAIDPKVILDLGANIGTSMALFAATFRNARIIGLEPDPDNARLCRTNLTAWGERCEVLEAAIWPEDGQVRLGGSATSVYRVGDTGRLTSAVSMSTLVDQYGAIDFVKVDIEGGEEALFSRNTAWTSSVQSLTVEVHSPYTAEACARTLERLGFSVSLRTAPRQARVVAWRDADVSQPRRPQAC